jgi:Tfp pilus assembly protein PilO
MTTRSEGVEKARADLDKHEKTKKEIKKYLSNIEAEKAKIERVAQEIEKTQQLLPSEISDTENINLLRRMSEDVNIKEVSIQPDTDDDRGFYIARRYRFKAKATFLQFLIMFEKISESKRILNVATVGFKKLDQPQRSKFQLIDGEFSLEAYKYNAAFKEDRGLDQLEKQFQEKNTAPKGKRKRPNNEGGNDA